MGLLAHMCYSPLVVGETTTAHGCGCGSGAMVRTRSFMGSRGVLALTGGPTYNPRRCYPGTPPLGLDNRA